MNKVLTFQCDFGSGISVVIKFDLAQYLHGSKEFAQNVEWSKQPTRSIIPRYIEWMHTVNAEIADAINGKYMYVAQLGPKKSQWKIWAYYPGGKRELLK